MINSFAASGTNDVSAIKPGGLWHNLAADIMDTWEQPTQRDIYIPAVTWHNRYFYNDEHLRRYNEKPWGLGYGISRQDNEDNWHGLYAMAFKDSFNRWEPFAGYAWEARWRPLSDDHFTLGAGYTLGVTARHNWNYFPVPAILPLASVGYYNLTFQATYIPGTRNNGNVFFGWLRWQF
ncbi:lipid IV(A) palmitoyltransferase PagP [Sodalis sp. RH21]|uniref:lipid IV(A) palmitoyltransferase PagP n=1 Tax=unclassified Sodalis (in: enterobacteria) TaxID=2636512 RepID=UPI0039B45C16